MIEKKHMDCDVVVLGGGPGGYAAAIRAAQLGASVILVEKQQVGGTCLNRGCIPTKVLLHASNAVGALKNYAEFGVKASFEGFDLQQLMDKKDKTVDQLRNGIGFLLKKNKVALLKGEAVLRSNDLVTVNNDEHLVEISPKKIIIATGSIANRLSIPGGTEFAVTTDQLQNIEQIPGRLLIIGGGAVGIEYAQIMSNLGSKVIMVEMKDRLLPEMDTDISKFIEKKFKEKKIEVYKNTSVLRLEKKDNAINVTISKESKEDGIETDVVLDASGRIGDLSVLNGNLSIINTNKYSIIVNEKMETSDEKIYAIGDITGEYKLAHVATHEGIVAAENCMGSSHVMEYDAIPFCVYTEPELASVGVTDIMAQKNGIKIKQGKFSFMASGKAHAIGKPEGFVKLIIDEKTEKILGVHIAGERATDIISEGVLAIQQKANASDLMEAINAHPTIAESINEAAQIVLGQSINT
ncbi:dihydrolipoyl dehydrogenase [Alkalibacter saccharofermentans]|uniref:Dihydrolipoyl dehydrogenase n=1 Tax=Alkalibacter saccharofermentans DSM 14828 TaxID=1120975 RepID=A0A1M4U2Q8_9FIRM|nr:dihydrolipoyl dehydrogenase [Alkalibacter saccharofermentans]SHE50924.1 dihydrolipoamide dehydrogenase [Alkalibacter saccharofermentans DSM 14828]